MRAQNLNADKNTNCKTKLPWEMFFEAEKEFLLDLCNDIIPDMTGTEQCVILSAFHKVSTKDVVGSGPEDPSAIDCRRHLKEIHEVLESCESPRTERLSKAITTILKNAGDTMLVVPDDYLEDREEIVEDNMMNGNIYITNQKHTFSNAFRPYRYDHEVSSEARRVMDVLCFYYDRFSKDDMPVILERVNRYFELPNIYETLSDFLNEWIDNMVPALSDSMQSALGAFIQSNMNERESGFEIDEQLAEAVVTELLTFDGFFDSRNLDDVLPSIGDFAEVCNTDAEDWSTTPLTMDELNQVLDELCELGYISYAWALKDELGCDFLFSFDPMPMNRVVADFTPGAVLNSEMPGLEMPAPIETMDVKSIIDFMASVNPGLYRDKETVTKLLSAVNDMLYDIIYDHDELLCAVGGFGLPEHPGRREAVVAHYPLLAPMNTVFFSDKRILLRTYFEGVTQSTIIDPALVKEISITVCNGYGDDVTNQLHEPYAKLQVLMDAAHCAIKSHPDDIPDSENDAINELSPMPFEVYLPRHTDEQLIQLAGYIQFALEEMEARTIEVVFKDEDDV